MQSEVEPEDQSYQDADDITDFFDGSYRLARAKVQFFYVVGKIVACLCVKVALFWLILRSF